MRLMRDAVGLSNGDISRLKKETLWGDSSEWCDFQTIVMVQATREEKGKVSVSRLLHIQF
jgi:hypothetical protein